MRDMLGSEDLIITTWRAMLASGCIINHPIGPGSALFEIDDSDPLVLWVDAVDAHRGKQRLPSLP
jgi:hypothetical protein